MSDKLNFQQMDHHPMDKTIAADAAAANERSVVHHGGNTTATTVSPGPARNVRAEIHTQLTSSSATG